MKTLLVTGASGFLGWNICQQAKSDWTIFGTTYSHSAHIPGVTLINIDLTIFKDLKKLFRETKPAGVIHTAALSDPNYCQENHGTSYRINTEVFNLRNAKLNPCKQQEIQMPAPRPSDASLNNAKAMQMGFRPDPIKVSLERLKTVANKKV
jgi:dTDP-4-dehydrorhamnose reductase